MSTTVLSFIITAPYFLRETNGIPPQPEVTTNVYPAMYLVPRNFSLLKEGIKTAVRVEPGVLRMYAVYDRTNPTHVTVFETYASKEAYESHIQTPHFKKYKTGTAAMVKSLELMDVVPIAFEEKKGQ